MKYEEFGFHDKDITNIDKVIESIHELVGIKCDRYYTLLFSVLLIILITIVSDLDLKVCDIDLKRISHLLFLVLLLKVKTVIYVLKYWHGLSLFPINHELHVVLSPTK
jgi:hypothetical protein